MNNKYYVTSKFKYRGLSRTIFQRGNSQGVWEIRLRHNGKQITKSLGTWIRDSAVEVAKRLLQASLEGRLEGVLTAIRPPSQQAKSVLPEVKIGELVAAYRTAPGQANPTTRNACISALKRVVELGLGTDPVWTDRGLGELNDDLVIRYREAKEGTLKGQSAVALIKTRNGGRSMLRQARALFTDQLLEYYTRRAGLVIPSVEKFRRAPGFSVGTRKDYQAPPDWLLAKTFAELEATRETHRDRYLVCWLALGFGLRKSEISAVRSDWFTEVDGRRYLDLKAVSCELGYGERDVTKNGQINPRIPVANGAWERFGHLIEDMAPGAYLIDGTMTWRVGDVFREVNKWLRSLGWKTQKGIHELRAYAGCQVILQDGMLNGSLWLRHGDISTTQQYYGRYITMRVTNTPLAAAPAPTAPRKSVAKGTKNSTPAQILVTHFATHSPVEMPANTIANLCNLVQYNTEVRRACDSNTMTYTSNSL